MQKATIVALLVVACCALFADAYNGQDIYDEPNCSIVSDHEHKFRNINDPTFYWVCKDGQQKADYIQCSENYAFMDSLQRCVPWEDWKWEEPYSK